MSILAGHKYRKTQVLHLTPAMVLETNPSTLTFCAGLKGKTLIIKKKRIVLTETQSRLCKGRGSYWDDMASS